MNSEETPAEIDEFVKRLRDSSDPKCHTAADMIERLWSEKTYFIKEIAYCTERLAKMAEKGPST